MSMSQGVPLPVPKALAALRRERCLSQQRLADLAGLALNTVWSIERGLTTYPSAQTLRKLAAGLGLGEQELRRRLGMHPPTAGGKRRRVQTHGAQQLPAVDPANRFRALTDAIVARWETLTPAQQDYAEAICWHLHQSLLGSPHLERMQEETV